MSTLDVPIYITETGIADAAGDRRPLWLETYIPEVERAVRDGMDVRGLMYWTLVDNFEVSHLSSRVMLHIIFRSALASLRHAEVWSVHCAWSTFLMPAHSEGHAEPSPGAGRHRVLSSSPASGAWAPIVPPLVVLCVSLPTLQITADARQKAALRGAIQRSSGYASLLCGTRTPRVFDACSGRTDSTRSLGCTNGSRAWAAGARSEPQRPCWPTSTRTSLLRYPHLPLCRPVSQYRLHIAAPPHVRRAGRDTCCAPGPPADIWPTCCDALV